jgi:hypothetical protein
MRIELRRIILYFGILGLVGDTDLRTFRRNTLLPPYFRLKMEAEILLESSVNSYQIFMPLSFQKGAFFIVTSEVRQTSHILFWFNTFLVKTCCKHGNENACYIRRGILLVECLIKNCASRSFLKVRSYIEISMSRIHVSVSVYLSLTSRRLEQKPDAAVLFKVGKRCLMCHL